MAHELSDQQYKSQVKAVWKATAWLTVITILEVGLALMWLKLGWGHKMVLNILLIFASLCKAFFIVAEFMHLKYETRALVLSILVPMAIFIWGIIAFLIEGNSIQWLRHMFD